MEVGDWGLEAEGWRLEVEVGGSKLGSWRLEAGGWELEASLNDRTQRVGGWANLNAGTQRVGGCGPPWSHLGTS